MHLAPEAPTHKYLSTAFGPGYVATDPWPSGYRHAKCLKISFPQGFDLFPANYFDLIVHNHVLEHIPGDFKDHLREFHRILARDGVMVFTIPDIKILQQVPLSIQGGESLSSDADRIAKFGQKDHFKWLCLDLLEFSGNLYSEFRLFLDPRNSESQTALAHHNAQGIVFFCRK